MNLRGYQVEALEAIEQSFVEKNKTLLVMATGGGKTIIFAHLAKHFADQGKRTLIIAHREELLTQAIDKIYTATGLRADLEKADYKASLKSPVVVASVQTLMARADRWPADHFGLVVIDEAHHMLAKSYLSTVGRFDPHAKVLGVTATPDRGDKKNLGKYFEEIAYEIGLPRLIREKFLSRITVKRLGLKIDLRAVRKTAGDYNEKDLGDAIEPHLKDVAATIAAEAWDRKLIVFLPLVSLAREFSELLNGHGITAMSVAGVDSAGYRHRALSWFDKEAGPGSALCNAMLLTEGFDQPDVDAIVCLRPTQIRSLFAQMVGRGTRVHPGKEDLLLLDFMFQTSEHNLVSVARLVCDRESDVDKMEKMIGGRKDVDILEAAEEIDEAHKRDVEEERLRRVKERLISARTRPKGTYDAMELFLCMGEDELNDYEPVLEWHYKPVTEGQATALLRAGFDPETITCRGHASKILDRLAIRRAHGLATPKQVKQLKKFGHPAPDKASFSDAGAFLDQVFGKRTVNH